MNIKIEDKSTGLLLYTTYNKIYYSKIYIGYKVSEAKGLFKNYVINKNKKSA